jgi:cytochrome c2
MSYDTGKPGLKWLGFQAGAALALALLPSQLLLGNALWRLRGEQIAVVAVFVGAYIASVAAIAVAGHGKVRARLAEIAVICLASLGLFALWLLIFRHEYSRPWLAATTAFAAFFIALGMVRLARLPLATSVGLGSLAVALQPFGEEPARYLTSHLASESAPHVTKATLQTNAYSLRVTFFEDFLCAATPCGAPRNGGGLDRLGPGILLASGDGSLYYIEYDESLTALQKTELAVRVPINSDEFVASGHSEWVWLFRVTDILVRERGQNVDLYAAHHHWDAHERCFSLRLSKLTSDYSSLLSGESIPRWRTVFDTNPCLPLEAPLPHSHSQRLFSGDESGGRIAVMTDGALLLSVGDHLFNGHDKPRMLSQDDTAQYGKTIRIDPETGESSIFTKGHRNPQGLIVDGRGTIFETEHGPRGGDELNVLREGRNYGWPFVTYGTDYRSLSWPLNATPGDHDGFERSLYSWVPSTAIGNLIRVSGDRFALWKDDLLIGSYYKTLWRVRVRDDRVAYAEPIQLRGANARIRDVLENRDGRIVLWLDSGTIAVLDAPVAEAARTGVQHSRNAAALFSTRCGSCHLGENAPGPHLDGIVNRPIASLSGYEYSRALQAMSGTWSEQNLDKFLEDPQRMAPGTSMNTDGIQAGDERELIISYLRSL